MALPGNWSAPDTVVAFSGCHPAEGERCSIALIFGSSRLTGASSGAPENDSSNLLSCSTASVARSVMSLSRRFQSASSRSRSRSGDNAIAGSRATNTDAVPIGVLAGVRENRPINWIIGPRLFFASCSAAPVPSRRLRDYTWLSNDPWVPTAMRPGRGWAGSRSGLPAKTRREQSSVSNQSPPTRQGQPNWPPGFLPL